MFINSKETLMLLSVKLIIVNSDSCSPHPLVSPVSFLQDLCLCGRVFIFEAAEFFFFFFFHPRIWDFQTTDNLIRRVVAKQGYFIWLANLSALTRSPQINHKMLCSFSRGKLHNKMPIFLSRVSSLIHRASCRYFNVC